MLVQLLSVLLEVGDEREDLRPFFSCFDLVAGRNLLNENSIFFIDFLKNFLCSQGNTTSLRVLDGMIDLFAKELDLGLDSRLCCWLPNLDYL